NSNQHADPSYAVALLRPRRERPRRRAAAKPPSRRAQSLASLIRSPRRRGRATSPVDRVQIAPLTSFSTCSKQTTRVLTPTQLDKDVATVSAIVSKILKALPLANREINRDFRRNRTSTPIFASDQHVDPIGYSRIPYATEQGISKRVSGNFLKEQGNLVKLQRNR